MRIQYFVAQSLDGYIADTKNSLDWLYQFEGGGSYNTFIKDVGAIAMGSVTYDWVLDNEILKDPAAPKPWVYTQPCWVFTTRKLREIAGDIRLVSGEIRPVYEEMAKVANGKNIWLVGGGELVGKFYDEGLLDDIIVGLAPVILGGGAALLPRRIATPPLKLLSTNKLDSGFLELHYEVARA